MSLCAESEKETASETRDYINTTTTGILPYVRKAKDLSRVDDETGIFEVSDYPGLEVEATVSSRPSVEALVASYKRRDRWVAAPNT